MPKVKRAILMTPLVLAVIAAPAHGAEEMWRREPRTTTPASDWSAYHAIVIPWTDDNGDGLIDERDGGDVLYVGTPFSNGGEGVVRLLEGRTGRNLWEFQRPPIDVGASTILAAGDVDGDGRPELVAGCGENGVSSATVLMYNWDGSLRWLRSASTTFGDGSRKSLSLADLDGDGSSEILASNEVLDRHGALMRRLQVPPCIESYAIDVDLDGVLEIACGSSVARQDGTAVFSLASGRITMVPVQWDGDAAPEFAVSGWGIYCVRIHDSDGTLLWLEDGPATSWPYTALAAGDDDFDGRSAVFLGEEVADPPAKDLVSYGPDMVARWRTPSTDLIVRSGGAVAWVQGDLTYLHQGQFELIALRGGDGAELFRLPAGGTPLWQMPIFADLDGDGIGEIITNDLSAPEPAVQAWRDPAWCPARAVHHQHAYVPDFIGADLRPAGPPTDPIDWAHVGFRQQRNDCPCTSPPDVVIRVSSDCTPGTTCATATVVPGRQPLRVKWTLPDGSSSAEAEPCFADAPGGLLEVTVQDGANCSVVTSLVLPPVVLRSARIEVEPTCEDRALQCARTVRTGMAEPVVFVWTLPDGSSSTEAEPCFRVDAAATVSVAITDADGCVANASSPVEPAGPEVLVELSGPGAVPLLATRIGGGVQLEWEASSSGRLMTLWSGVIGDWTSHAAIACVAVHRAQDPRPDPVSYYLVGEVDCQGISGPLGNTSSGTPRFQPASSCR